MAQAEVFPFIVADPAFGEASVVSLTLLYISVRPELVEGRSVFTRFRSWFDRLTTNGESKDFWDTTLAAFRTYQLRFSCKNGLCLFRHCSIPVLR